MALSKPKTIYGVHSVTMYDRSTYQPYGIIKVLGNLQIALAGEFNDLYGGSSAYPWDSETGTLDATLSGTIKEIPNFAFEKFLGASSTANAAETSGNVGTLTNKKGTSVMDSSTGIASVAAISGSEADLKDGLYAVVATDTDEVDVYAMSDVDFDKGTDKAFLTDGLKIASAVSITASTASNVAGFGFKLMGGSGTIGMEVGDTAYFYVRKINTGSDIVVVGASTATFPEFGAFVTTQKKGNGDTFAVQLFRCKALGLPLSFNEKEWLNSDVTIKSLYDADANAVFEIRRTMG